MAVGLSAGSRLDTAIVRLKVCLRIIRVFVLTNAESLEGLRAPVLQRYFGLPASISGSEQRAQAVKRIWSFRLCL